jgi:Outer membrane protein beta-barrel domain
MTRLRLVLLSALLVFPSAVVAQEFGLKGGVTLANINVREPHTLPAELQWCCSPWDGTRRDMAVGLSGGFNVRPGFAIQTEVLFTRRGFRIGAGDGLPGARLRMSYVEVPVLLQYVGGAIRLHAGPSIGVATSVSQWSEDVTRSGDFLRRESLQDVDVSVVVGMSLHRGRVSLEGRYVHGARNILLNAPTDASVKHKSLMLLLGFRVAGPGCAAEPPPNLPPHWRR